MSALPEQPGLRLPFSAPLAWHAMLGYLSVRAIAGVERVDGVSYRRTVLVDGIAAVIEIRSGGPQHLELRAHGLDHRHLDDAAARGRRVFNLDLDIDAATRHLRGDPAIGPRLRARPGIRAPGAWDPFELGVRAITGQQVSVAGAGTLIARLVARHGTAVAGFEPHGLSQLFPAPATLAVADLSGLGLTGARAAAINTFAGAVADRTLQLDRRGAHAELVESIRALPGLGSWTAEYIALRLGDPDAFPHGDLGIRRALSDIPGTPITARHAAELAERWRPWRAHSAAQLWIGDQLGRRPARPSSRSSSGASSATATSGGTTPILRHPST